MFVRRIRDQQVTKVFLLQIFLCLLMVSIQALASARPYSTTEFSYEFVSAISMAFNIADALFTVS
jgi:hypothetical protein